MRGEVLVSLFGMLLDAKDPSRFGVCLQWVLFLEL